MVDYYQWIQVSQIVLFGALLALDEWRSMALPLLVSSIIYAVLEPFVTPYLFDILFDFLVVEVLIRSRNPHAKVQILLISASICYSCLAFWEYPTKSMIIYNHYAIVTNGINLLQLMGAWNGIAIFFRHLVGAIGFNGAYLRGIIGEAMEISVGVAGKEKGWNSPPSTRTM